MPYVPTSVVLTRLIESAPAETVTLGWLLDHLRTRSFGIILLLLGVCGLLPVVSPVAGLLLAIPGYQMLSGCSVPTFSRSIGQRPLATSKMAAVLARIIPALRAMERFVRPRWPTPFQATKRIIGGFIVLLGACLLAPLPFSNIPVALTIVLVAFAYLEEDGVLLAAGLLAALALFVAGGAALWGTIAGAVWLIE